MCVCNTWMRKSVLAAVMLGSAVPAYWAIRLAWADHLSRTMDSRGVTRAVDLAPGDADIRLRLADARQSALGGDAAGALAAAVKLDPGDAAAWVRLGVAKELRGDLQGAERDLLEAARVSRQFAPRWALANYYFRRGAEARFWSWAGECLRIGYSDVSPVFQLCWRMRPDASLIERIVPERNATLNAYVLFWI